MCNIKKINLTKNPEKLKFNIHKIFQKFTSQVFCEANAKMLKNENHNKFFNQNQWCE